MSDKKSITINISQECFEKLHDHFDVNKSPELLDIPGLETIEELAASYLEQIVCCDDQFKNMQNKMQAVLQTLNDKGIDMIDIFNSLNDKVDLDETPSVKKNTIKKS